MSVAKPRLWASQIAMISAMGISALGLATSAHADQTPKAPVEASDANAIVVTAQKRSENVQKVPISIVAISGAGLRNANVENILDLPRLAPDLAIAKGAQASYTRVSIRGIGAASNTAVEPSVASFVDGVYIPRPGALLTNFMDMQGVEVLRGPQGTLFGRNASVGAISVQTATPKQEWSGVAGVEYGTANRRKVEGTINAPLAKNVAIRVAGMLQDQDGFWHNNLDGKTYGGTKNAAVRGSLKADFGKLEWTVRADYAHTTGDGFANFAFDPNSVSPLQLATLQAHLGGQLPDTSLSDRNTNQVVNAALDDRQWGVMSDLSLSLGDYKLRLINSYRDWQSGQTDGDVAWLPISLVSRVGTYSSRSNNQELQIISPKDLLGGRLDFVGGLYYFGEDYATSEKFQQGSAFCAALVGPAHPGLLGPCNNLYANGGGVNATDLEFNQSLQSYAAYAQANAKLLRDVKLTLGGRYTKDDKNGTFDQMVPNPFFATLRAPENDVLQTSGSRFTGRASLNYTPTRDALFFANFSTGYKSGGFNSGGGVPALGSDLRTYAPETTTNYELGAKTSWFNRRLTANLTLYRMDIDGFQDRSFNGISFVVRNAGGLRHQGAEFESALTISPAIRLNASVSYLDSKFTNYTPASALPGLTGTQDLTGKPATFAPKWTGTVGAQVGTTLANTGMRWQMNTNLSFTSSYFDGLVNDNNPQTIQPGYQLLSARLALFGKNDRWSVAVFGNNLTNTVYRLGSAYQLLGAQLGLNNGVFAGSTAIRELRADPRTIGAALKVQF